LIKREIEILIKKIVEEIALKLREIKLRIIRSKIITARTLVCGQICDYIDDRLRLKPSKFAEDSPIPQVIQLYKLVYNCRCTKRFYRLLKIE
jgi:hypothetical protein